MNLTKNQIYIISAVVIIAVIYFMFFRKKKTPAIAMAPKTGESGFFGEDWGWGTGPQTITPAEAIYSMSGPAGNSVAGTMESGFDVRTGLVDNNGRYGNNDWPSNPMSQTGMFRKVQNSPNAGPSPQMPNAWPIVGESNFAGSWLK